MGSVQRGKLGQPSKILPTVLVVGTNTVVGEGVMKIIILILLLILIIIILLIIILIFIITIKKNDKFWLSMKGEEWNT